MMALGALTILFMEATGSSIRANVGPMRPTPNGALKSAFAALTHFLWNGGKHDPHTAGGQTALFALSLHTVCGRLKNI